MNIESINISSNIEKVESRVSFHKENMNKSRDNSNKKTDDFCNRKKVCYYIISYTQMFIAMITKLILLHITFKF
jgi:hypothetical protein